jgi:hypothetical protein
MTTYTITLTGVFEAEDLAEAYDDFREWAAMPGCVEAGGVVTVTTEADEVWARLSPAAKAEWLRAMMPEPEPELTACPECSEVAVTTTAGVLPVCLACDWTGWPEPA